MEYLLVENEDLLAGARGFQQLGCDLLFSRKDNSVRRKNPQRGACMADGLHRIFNLVQSPYKELNSSE